VLISTIVNGKSLTEITAASSFAMDSERSKIKSPPSITTVVIDLGAHNFDYLYVMEYTEDKSVGLEVFAPPPDSIKIPLTKRVAGYSMRNITGTNVEQYEVYKIRIETSICRRRRGGGSNMHKKSSENKFWCVDAIVVILY